LAAAAGYPFLRDAELEPYRGTPLALRAVGCGLAYALLWGVYMFIGGYWGLPGQLEIFQLVVLAAIPVAVGTFAAFVAFDLEPLSAFLLSAMYFVICVLLRIIAGMPALPGLMASG
jgi:hypothetical protein